MDSSFQPSLMAYPPQSSTKAFVASSGPTSVPDWFVDSAATHHLTNDLSNMHLYQPYTGPEQVLVGNGSTLPIQHSGKGILPTPTHSFRLNQVLHVPSLTSNLVSINNSLRTTIVPLPLMILLSLFRTKSRRTSCLEVIMSMVCISFQSLLTSVVLHFHLMHISVLLFLHQLGIVDLVTPLL